MGPDGRPREDGPAAEGPIRRRKLSDAVRDRLLALLADGAEPGDVLPSERELMARFGVGRPAVREAMQSLQAMGLIDVRHGERPRVARATVDAALDRIGLTMRHTLLHSPPTLEHLKEVRIATETHLAGLAAARREPGDIDRLRGLLGRQEAVAGDGTDAFLRLDGAFHLAVADAAGNPVFAATVRALFEWLSDFHVAAVHRAGLERLTMDEHAAILARVSDGDARGAARAMRDHLERANALYRS